MENFFSGYLETRFIFQECQKSDFSGQFYSDSLKMIEKICFSFKGRRQWKILFLNLTNNLFSYHSSSLSKYLSNIFGYNTIVIYELVTKYQL